MPTSAGTQGALSQIAESKTGPGLAGLAEQASMLAAGSTSSTRLTERALAAIAETQPTLNAFRCVRAEAARDEAENADRRLAAGERLPLLGVPVAIKDDTNIIGETTKFGCAGEFAVATEDAEVVRRLRAAGAVIVGKTQTPEIGQWPITAGSAFGVTRNPWNLDHTPGGSSGGTAAAVAAGIVAVAVGSDGAGSIRIPAAWTDLVGIKPQRGRVSDWPDPEAFNGLTAVGPLGRSVGDAALLLDVISGNHPGDLHRPAAPEE
ncbi:MAG: amidase, partial [Thermoleophilia bacterium]|nr:amidase [Thermoleophilia bacterium]